MKEDLRKLKGILKLIDKYPNDYLPLWRALMVVISPQQREIVELINCTGWMDVGSIAIALGVTHQTVSSQLAILKDVGLVENRKEGRKSFYYIDKKYMPNFL